MPYTCFIFFFFFFFPGPFSVPWNYSGLTFKVNMYLPLTFLWLRQFAWHMMMSQPQQSLGWGWKGEQGQGQGCCSFSTGRELLPGARLEVRKWSAATVCGAVWKLSLSGTCHQCLMCNISNCAGFYQEHTKTVKLNIYTHWIQKAVINLLWPGPKLPLHLK